MQEYVCKKVIKKIVGGIMMNKNFVNVAINSLNKEISFIERDMLLKRKYKSINISNIKLRKLVIVEEFKEPLYNLSKVLGLPNNWIENVLNSRNIRRSNVDVICDWTGTPILKLRINEKDMVLDVEIIEYNKHQYIPIEEVGVNV